MRSRRSPVAMLALLVLVLGAGSSASASSAEPRAGARVVNGSEVTAEAFAARWSSVARVSVSGSLCGGTVVAARLVVTAAHCVDQGATPATTTVHVGSRDRALQTPVAVANIQPHPSYDAVSLRYDVAVLHLAADAGTPTVDVVGPNEDGSWGGGYGKAASAPEGAWVAGWGITENGLESQMLREALVPVAADSSCAQPGSVDFATMLCAGLLDTDASAATNGVDSCQGDSGGPLLTAVAGTWRLSGLVSWGGECASDRHGVYTRLAAMRPFLAEQGVPLGAGSMPVVVPVTGGGAVAELPQLLAPADGARFSGPPSLSWSLPPGWQTLGVQYAPASRYRHGDSHQQLGASATSFGFPSANDLHVSSSDRQAGDHMWSVRFRSPTGEEHLTDARRFSIAPRTRLALASSRVRLARGGRHVILDVSYATNAATLRFDATLKRRRVKLGRGRARTNVHLGRNRQLQLDRSGELMRGSVPVKLRLQRKVRRGQRLLLRVAVTDTALGTTRVSGFRVRVG